MTKYRTIVADPPWDQEWNANIGIGRSGRAGLPYPSMSLEAICELNVPAEPSSHLWLWTTATFLWDAPRVVLSWGFRPSYTIAWCKPGLGVGGRFRHTVEYLLFSERGAQLPITRRDLPTHFIWPRGEHSAKPDAFYDLVESVSPGPYLEMFARRQRLGWDTWGNEALNHTEMGAVLMTHPATSLRPGTPEHPSTLQPGCGLSFRSKTKTRTLRNHPNRGNIAFQPHRFASARRPCGPGAA